MLLVLSDRNIAKDRLPVPAPMAVGAIQTRLVDKSLRCDANIIVETASARDPHHFAVLLGFGATAIYPYLAYETLAKLVDSKAIDKPYRAVMLNYRNGINKGLYKIMSKMGSRPSPPTAARSCSKRSVCIAMSPSSASRAWSAASAAPASTTSSRIC